MTTAVVQKGVPCIQTMCSTFAVHNSMSCTCMASSIQCYSSHHDTTSTTPTPPTPHHILTTPRLHQTCTNLCVCVCARVRVSFLCIPHLEACNIPLMGHKTTTGNHTSNGISALVQHASCVLIVPLSLPCLSSAIPPRLLSQGQSYVCVSACTAYHTTEASCSTTTRPARRVGSSQDTCAQVK